MSLQLLFLFRLTPLTFPSHSLNMGTNDIWLANSNRQFSLSLLDTIYHPSNLIRSLSCPSPTQGRTHSFLTAPQPSYLSLCSLFLLQGNMFKTAASKDKSYILSSPKKAMYPSQNCKLTCKLFFFFFN